jgi:hypothetical protein
LLSSALALDCGRSTSNSGEQRRGDHEDDQQHQHHVDVGTTLISDFSLRRLRRREMAADMAWLRSVGASALALQDRAELFGEGLVTHRHALDAGGEAVVGPHRRDRHEQADGGGEQRFGNARRDQAMPAWAPLLIMSCMVTMMPNTVPTRPTYGAVEPMLASSSRLRSSWSTSRVGGAHGALGAFELGAAVQAALAQAGEFAEPASKIAANCSGVRRGSVAAYSLPRSAPDQKRPRTRRLRVGRLNTRALRKMITQLTNEPTSSRAR